jgi:predicted permease
MSLRNMASGLRSLFRRVSHGLRSRFGKERAASELDEELRGFLEMATEEKMKHGVSRKDALRAVRLEEGTVDIAKEIVRSAGWESVVETCCQDLRYSARMLRKSPGFTAVAVLTLALGIGANTAMFSIVDAWLLRPLPLKNPQELAAVWRTRSQATRQPAFFDFYHDYLVWSSRNRTFASLAATFEQRYALTGAGEPEQVHGAVATWNLFQTVGATSSLGRLFEAEDARRDPACVISQSLWAERFHSAKDIVGRTIQLNRKLYRVLGVLPANFSLRVLERPFETAVWTVITENDSRYNATEPSPVAVIGRLKPGVSISQAEADLWALQSPLNRQFSDEPEGSGVLVENLQQDNTRTIRGSLLLLFGAVSVLLLIACVNTGSLILGRNAQRAKEFAVRVALGCGIRRLLQQLTAEILTIFVLGGLLGLLLAFGLLRMFAAWNPFEVLPPGGLSLDRTVLAATAAIVCLAALSFGSLPALRALNARGEDALRTSSQRLTSSREQLRWRNLFVAMEVSLSVVLLVGAGLLISTFIKIGSEPLGFQTRDVFVGDVPLPHTVYRTNSDAIRFCEKLLQGLRESPNIRAAGAAVSWLFNVDGLTPVEIETQRGLTFQQLPQAATFKVSPGYFDALGIPLLWGRAFNDHDRADSIPVAVINQQMALQYFAGQDPLGKRIRFRHIDRRTPKEPWLTIVGVVGSTRSIRYNHVQWDRYPAVYAAFFQGANVSSPEAFDAQTLFLYVQGRPPFSPTVVASAVHDLDPDLPLGRLRTTGEVVSALRSQPRVRATLLGSFGLLTLFLAAIGVGGVMGQMVEQRRRDIGIRIAVGARPSDIQRLVLSHAFRVTLAGVIVGSLAAGAVARLLRSFLFGISALDPLTFAAVIALLALVALLAAYVPARRAATVDPIVALHRE